MTRAIIAAALLLVAGCEGCDERFRNPSVAPAARNCADCIGLCKPFQVTSCKPINYSESGRIAYVACACGPSTPTSPESP